MKTLKIISVFFVFIVVAALVIPFVIPKKMVLDWFVRTVESHYPVQLSLKDAQLRFLPSLGIGLDEVDVQVKGQDQKETLAHAGRIRVSLGWRELFRKEVGIKKIDASDLEIVQKTAGKDPQKIALSELRVRDVSLKSPNYKADVFIKGILNGLSFEGDMTASLEQSQPDQWKIELKSKDFSLANLPPIEEASIKASFVTDGSPKSKPVISGDLAAKKIKLPDYDLTDAFAHFVYHDPILNISELRGAALDGAIGGTAKLDLGGTKPAYDFDISFRRISVEKLGSVGRLVTGKGDLAFKGSGKGTEEKDLSTSLTGNGDLNVSEVSLPVVKVMENIFSSPAWDVVGAIPGALNQTALQGLRGLDSKVSTLASAFQMVEGRIQVPKLELKFPNALTHLTGSIGIDKSLDFSGTTDLDKDLVSSLVLLPKLRESLGDGKGIIAVPVRVSGTIAQPLVSVDTNFIKNRVQDFVKQEAQSKVNRMIQDATKPPEEGGGVTLPSKDQLKDVLNFGKKE